MHCLTKPSIVSVQLRKYIVRRSSPPFSGIVTSRPHAQVDRSTMVVKKNTSSPYQSNTHLGKFIAVVNPIEIGWTLPVLYLLDFGMSVRMRDETTQCIEAETETFIRSLVLFALNFVIAFVFIKGRLSFRRHYFQVMNWPFSYAARDGTESSVSSRHLSQS